MTGRNVRGLAVKSYLRALRESPQDLAVSEAHGLLLADLDRLPQDPEKPTLIALVATLQAIPERHDLRLGRILREASYAKGRGLEEIEDPADYATEAAPRWPSGLAPFDERSGGYYGVTILAGEAGVGKSLAATGSALEAARAGWRVVYVDAELDRRTITRRILQYLRRPLHEVHELLDTFHVLRAGDGLTVDLLARRCSDLVYDGTDRVLVVLDSVNTVAELALEDDGMDAYFGSLRRLLRWASNARRESEGDVSFLLVSELNARGETKGRKADYVADLVLRLRKGDHPDHVEIDVTKGRESGTAELGMFWRDHARGRFVHGGAR